MRPFKLSFLSFVCAVAVVFSAKGQQLPTASDPYLAWATQQWGASVVNDPTQEATVWGESADPDGDHRTNLEEYALGTDPRHLDADPVVRDYGAARPGYLTLTYPQRADDGALVVFPQYSTDLQTWWPAPPRDAFSWQGDSTYYWNTTTGAVVNGMQTVSRVCSEPLASSVGAFARVLVIRNGTLAIGSPLDAVQFFDSVSGLGGSVVDSNSVVLTGFAGTVTVAVTGGAHLIVNGIDVGASANVAAGSTVRIEATSLSTASSSSFNLSIGGVVTKTWNLVTRPASLPAGVSGTASGYSSVNASVGESGAASINLPITVSPGTGGMEPKLAIAYSSQGGNGLMGVGFGLSGLSAITRTGPVQYIDGIKGGVSFGPNDRFTADGQRLLLYSGTWGGDNAEYRTETESFSKIVSQGTTTAGPQSWVMKTKAGLTYEYGTSVDSRILANRSSVSGDTAVLVWALTRITDNVGNSIEFTYATPDGSESGNPRIASIAYTVNATAGLPAHEQVVFSYETRPDVRTSYVAGAKVVMSKRMTAVECQQNGSVSRRYEFAYQQAEVSNNSQLVSVTERGIKPADGTASWQTFPPTIFAWDQKPAGTPKMSATTTATDPTLATLGFSKSPPSLIVQGDFNGDGRMDVMQFDDHGGTSIWIAFGNSDGTLTKVTATGFTTADADDYTKNTTYSRIFTGDFNGDGKTDVLQMNRSGGNNWLALSNGDGSFNVLHGAQLGALQNVGQTGDYQTDVFALDLNGDGRTDIVLLNKSGNNRVFLAKGDGSFSEVSIPANDPFRSFKIAPDNDGTNTYLVPGDFNGDGLGDILLLYADGNHQLALSNGDGTFTVRTGAQLGSIAGVGFRRTRAAFVSGDFNGDGLTDLAHFDNDTYPAWLALCKGDGTFDVITNPPSLQGLPLSVPASSELVVGDFVGDGFSDIFHASYPYSGSGWLVSSKGDTSFVVQNAGQLGVLDGQVYDKFNDARQRSRFFVGDFDGDGTEDILYLYQEADVSYHTRSIGFNADRVVQVTNGHGGYTKFSYKPLTDPSVYTKGSGAIYPYCDVIAAMYVVSLVVTRNGLDGDAFTVQASPAPGEATTTYSYEGAQSLLDGRGYQGFAAVQSNNQDTGITSRTEYVTLHPNLAGRPAHEVQTLSDGTIITETLYNWIGNPTTLPSGLVTRFPYSTSTVTKDYEINNGKGAAPIKTTTVSGVVYDSFGNLTHSLTDYGGGFTEETTSIYTNDTDHWWLGRLSDTVVVQTSPGQPSATRHSTFQYSPTNGQLTRETIVTPESQLRLQKDYVHDAFGNIYQSTLTDLGTGETRTTTTTYTPNGRFIYQTTNALGQTETKDYNPIDGTVRAQTGPNGLKTTWTYDGYGRPLTATGPDGTQTLTQYLLCTPGNGVPPRAVYCVRTQSSGSGPSTVYFDILDRQIRQDATGFDGSTISAHKIFGKKGQVIHTSIPFFSSAVAPTAPSSQYTTIQYDAAGRMFQQDTPGQETESGPRTTTTVYAGLSATVTNPKKQTFQSTVDLRGRTGSSTGFGTDIVTNTHDPYGNLTQVDDGNGHVTSMQYDGRGNKIWMVEPNSGKTTYGYNAFGELTSQTDALARVTTLSYDGLGRLLSRVEPDAPGIYNGVQAAGIQIKTDWTYDTAPNGIGKLAYVSRPSDGYLERYRYDSLGRLTETITQVGVMQFPTWTAFDEYSRPETICYPTGFAVHNSYNQYGHLAFVYDAATPSKHYWTANRVNARGQVLQEHFGNDLVSRHAYDANTGLLQTIRTGSDAGTPTGIQNLAYTFDNINNLSQRQDLNRAITENFTYDATNQLSGVACSAADPITITCDHLGNIASRSDVGSYTYGEHGAGPHAVTSITGTNGLPSRTLSYNAVGNCYQDGTTSLDYNAANQPVAIRATGGSITFSYTPSRARLKRTELVNGTLTNRVYVGSLYERDDGPAGIIHTCFIPAAGGVVAIHTEKQVVGSATATQTRYVHKDHLGSVQALTDENGYLVETQDYDAWGRRRTFDATSGRFTVSGPSSQTDRGFTGHEMLDVVGLIHMNGRIYDPTIGRFLSVDPGVQEASNLQNLNRYCYVLNNPLSLSDPSGFFFKGLGHFLSKNWKQIGSVIIGVALAVFAPELLGLAGTFLGAVVGGAAGGFGSAFTGTLLSGGSLGDALKAGFEGGAIGAATAGAIDGASAGLGLHGLTEDFESGRYSYLDAGKSTEISGTQFFEKVAEKVAVHGVIGGIAADVQGDKFAHGFLAGGTSGLASPFIAGANLSPGGQVAVAAIVGGTSAELGGGKFSNGAITGAFVYLFNEQGGSSESSGGLSDTSAFATNLFGGTSAYAYIMQEQVSGLNGSFVDGMGAYAFPFAVVDTTISVSDALTNPSDFNNANAGVSTVSTYLAAGSLSAAASNPLLSARLGVAGASFSIGFVLSTRTNLVITPLAWGFHNFVDSTVSIEEYRQNARRDFGLKPGQ